jgi:hypothetical protein
MQGVLEQNLSVTQISEFSEEAAVRKVGLIAKLFGCWHKELSRPFTTKTSSYRTCLDCGARRKFNPENLKTSGPFYFPPSIKPDPFL